MIESDSLHRLVKMLADNGEASSLAHAHELFSKYGVVLRFDASMFGDVSSQIIGLTVLNCSARTFLGNVLLEGPTTGVLCVPGFDGVELGDYAKTLGIKNVPSTDSTLWPVITLTQSGSDGIRPWADGWCFGLGERGRSSSLTWMPAACVAAAGLAVSEAFSLLRRDNPYAGRRKIELSLWEPEAPGCHQGPSALAELRPLWMVGLGHLGQAYAWTLGFSRFSNNAEVFLQDVDHITKSTLSTSLLSECRHIGDKKSRVAAAWFEDRGVKTSIIERRFDANQCCAPTEPAIALFGVDNPAARRALEGAGFRFVIDAGLGSGHKTFRGIRVRTFPGPSDAASIWAASEEIDAHQVNISAYKRLLGDGHDPCGVTTLASKAVGAPFVGCVAAGLVVAQLHRYLLGEESHGLLDLNLRDPARVFAA